MLQLRAAFLFILFSIQLNTNAQRPPGTRCAGADAGPDVYLYCYGASSIIGTPGQNGYSYYWLPSKGLNNPNIPQPTAAPSATTTYTLIAVPPNLIQNWDFESGLTNVNTDYGIFPNGIGCSQGGYFGSVQVVSNPFLELGSQYCDVTARAFHGNKMLFVDGTCTQGRRVWYQTVPVTPNNTYYFSGWATAASWLYGYGVNDIAKIRVRINGTDVIQNFADAYQCGRWSEFSTTWTSGSATTALIEIFDDNLNSHLNDFCLDDLFFSSCPVTTDQVKVEVGRGNGPAISPAGPIDVCFQWEGFGTTALSSNSPSGNQWYKDGIPLNGETNQNITVSSSRSDMGTGNYSVSVNGCLSQNVYVKFKPYGEAQSSDNVTPYSYCKGKTGILKQGDFGFLSNNVQYYWQVNGIAQNYCNASSNVCNVYFPDSYSSSTASITATVVTDGCRDAITYSVKVGSQGVLYSLNSCLSTPTAFNINENSAYTEDWDFGADATPRYQTHTGTGYTPSYVNISFASPGIKSVRHSSSSTYGSYPICWEDVVQINVDGNCKVAATQSGPATSNINLFPNPAKSSITLQAEDVIEAVEISAVASHLPIRIGGTGSASLRLDLRKFDSGVYTCKVKTKKGVYYAKFVVSK